jgi:hypothetical protein
VTLRPCHSPATPCHDALIHTCHTMPRHAPAILRQCHVLRESPHGSRKYPNWYASDNNLHGTLNGSRKKPNMGRSPARRLWMANANSHVPCRAMPHYGLEKSLPEQHGCCTAWMQHGMCESNMAALCESNGEDTI